MTLLRTCVLRMMATLYLFFGFCSSFQQQPDSCHISGACNSSPRKHGDMVDVSLVNDDSSPSSSTNFERQVCPESPLGPILVVSDLHGHVDLLKQALRKGCELAGRRDLEVVLLGDYVDNGPHIVDLLEYLSTQGWKKEFPRINLRGIMGNHDLAALLALDPSDFNANPNFYYHGKDYWGRWGNFQCPTIKSLATQVQYNCTTREEFQRKFPENHWKWLRSLPFYLKIDQYIFVHAGIRDPQVEPLSAQLNFLDKRDLSDLSIHVYRGGGYGLPDQLTNKDWSRSNFPPGEYVVVTGHNKYCEGAEADNFVASHRIGFHSCACQISAIEPSLSLHCGLLPRGSLGTTTDQCEPVFFGVSYNGEYCETTCADRDAQEEP